MGFTLKSKYAFIALFISIFSTLVFFQNCSGAKFVEAPTQTDLASTAGLNKCPASRVPCDTDRYTGYQTCTDTSSGPVYGVCIQENCKSPFVAIAGLCQSPTCTTGTSQACVVGGATGARFCQNNSWGTCRWMKVTVNGVTNISFNKLAQYDFDITTSDSGVTLSATKNPVLKKMSGSCNFTGTQIDPWLLNGGPFNLGHNAFSFDATMSQQIGNCNWMGQFYSNLEGVTAGVQISATRLTNTINSGNGICGLSKNSCSSGVFEDVADSATKFLWNCKGIDGGLAASCSSSRPIVVSGTCGTSNNVCISGTLSDTADTTTQYKWSCVGANGGTNATCSASKPASPVNGSCGSQMNICTAGSFTDTPDTGSQYLWMCAGQNGGTTASCTAIKPINGSCGAINNSCMLGSLSDTTDTATQYKWSCMGQNGGTAANCTVDKPVIPVDGTCGATNNSCVSGTLVDAADSATQYLWTCAGSNGGATRSCSANIPVAANPGQCGATNNVCAAGTLQDIADTSTQYLWRCVGTNGGTTDSCSAAISNNPTPVAVDGQCGSSNNSCIAGDLSDTADSATQYNWNCSGRNGGATRSCSAAIPATPVGGACGGSTNTCQSGTFVDLADSESQYIWSCNGQNGGANQKCYGDKPFCEAGTATFDSTANTAGQVNHCTVNWSRKYYDPSNPSFLHTFYGTVNGAADNRAFIKGICGPSGWDQNSVTKACPTPDVSCGANQENLNGVCVAQCGAGETRNAQGICEQNTTVTSSSSQAGNILCVDHHAYFQFQMNGSELTLWAWGTDPGRGTVGWNCADPSNTYQFLPPLKIWTKTISGGITPEVSLSGSILGGGGCSTSGIAFSGYQRKEMTDLCPSSGAGAMQYNFEIKIINRNYSGPADGTPPFPSIYQEPPPVYYDGGGI